VPLSLALIAGLLLGSHAVWLPAGLVTVLLGLGIALREDLGVCTVFLAAGLAVASLEKDRGNDPEPDEPISLRVRLTGEWALDARGWSAPAMGEWLQAGEPIERWERRVWLVLPADLSPPESRCLSVRGFLRRAPAPANGFRRRSGPWIVRIKSLRLVDEIQGCTPDLVRPLRRLGLFLREKVEAKLDERSIANSGWSAILIRVFLLGDVRALPAPVARGLRAAGLAHLTALSGLHVGLIAGLVLLASAGVARSFRLVAAVLAVATYVCLAGTRPSLVRASLMIFAVIASWLVRRPPQAVNTLAWVAGAMAFLRPAVMKDVGFLLTVTATAGILVLAPLLQRRWRRLPPWLAQALSVSVSANLAVLPWTLGVFHLATPLSPLWNLFAIPWTAVSLGLVFIWLLFSLLIPPLACLPASLLEIVGQPLGWIGELPAGAFVATPVGFGWCSACLLALTLTIALLSRWRRALVAALGSVGLILLAAPDRPSAPEVVLIDVGQGDAILLRDRQHALLVDGGGWTGSDIAQRILVPTLGYLGITRLSGAVMTHPDIDHCRGLIELASYVPIDRLYIGMGWGDDRCATELLNRPGFAAQVLWRGDELLMGRWRLRCLHPGAGARRGRNDRSLVLLAETSNRKVLLTGDLEASGEREILKLAEALGSTRIDILKVGHHGSTTSTSPELLRSLRPRLALISCGIGNRYGHPSDSVLRRLKRSNVPMLRTDLHGAVRVALPSQGPMAIKLPGLPRSDRP
jgi:competence protein ComEC